MVDHGHSGHYLLLVTYYVYHYSLSSHHYFYCVGVRMCVSAHVHCRFLNFLFTSYRFLPYKKMDLLFIHSFLDFEEDVLSLSI